MKRADWFFVTALLLFAAGLRFTGIANGQPNPAYASSTYPKQMLNEQTPLQPDEYFHVTIPLEMVVKRTLNPRFFEYPSFFINVNFVTFWLTGAGNGISLEDWHGQSSRTFAPFHLYVIGRVYSVLGGLLAVAATYAAARRIAGRFAAAGAGLLVAASFTMVQHAHYTTQSSISGGLAALSIWASFACVADKHPRTWLFVLSGVAAGFAAGCRYNLAAVTIVVFLAGCVLLYRHRGSVLRLVLLGWLAAPAAFVFSTPFAVLDYDAFIEGFRYLTGQYLSTGVNVMREFLMDPLRGMLFEYRHLIIFGIGVPASLAVLVGLYAAWESRPHWSAFFRRGTPALFVFILLLYLIPYSLVNLRILRPNHSDHMLIPVIPAFAIIAGVGVGWLYERLPFPRRLLAPALSLALIVVPLTFSVQMTSLLHQGDTRLVMQAWVYDHLPRGSRIHLSGPYNVPLDSADYTVTQTFVDGIVPLEQLREEDVDYLIRSDAWRFDAERFHENVPVSYREMLADYDRLLDTAFPRIAWIERPVWGGHDWVMNMATFWHNPGLIVYCLNERSCAVVR